MSLESAKNDIIYQRNFFHFADNGKKLVSLSEQRLTKSLRSLHDCRLFKKKFPGKLQKELS